MYSLHLTVVVNWIISDVSTSPHTRNLNKSSHQNLRENLVLLFRRRLQCRFWVCRPYSPPPQILPIWRDLPSKSSFSSILFPCWPVRLLMQKSTGSRILVVVIQFVHYQLPPLICHCCNPSPCFRRHRYLNVQLTPYGWCS